MPDDTPIEPPLACPVVDEALARSYDIEALAKEIVSEIEAQGRIGSLANEIEIEISHVCGALETLRSRCSDLRCWGYDWERLAEDADEARRESESALISLQKQISQLKAERKEERNLT